MLPVVHRGQQCLCVKLVLNLTNNRKVGNCFYLGLALGCNFACKTADEIVLVIEIWCTPLIGKAFSKERQPYTFELCDENTSNYGTLLATVSLNLLVIWCRCYVVASAINNNNNRNMLPTFYRIHIVYRV